MEKKIEITEDAYTINISVNKAISAKKKFSFRDFINSPVVIWFLSTIIVGLVTWEYTRLNEAKVKNAEKKALSVKTKFDLEVLCDLALSEVEGKDSFTYNNISSVCSYFRYTPTIGPKRQERVTFIEELNEISQLEPSANINELRKEAYNIFLSTNKEFVGFEGWISPPPVADLSTAQKTALQKTIAFIKKLREYSRHD